jgi:LSD1 subclass zinc finger protein
MAVCGRFLPAVDLQYPTRRRPSDEIHDGPFHDQNYPTAHAGLTGRSTKSAGCYSACPFRSGCETAIFGLTFPRYSRRVRCSLTQGWTL